MAHAQSPGLCGDSDRVVVVVWCGDGVSQGGDGGGCEVW